MSEKDAFERYLLALRKTAIDEKTEHTDRLALEEESVSEVAKLLQGFFSTAPEGIGRSQPVRKVFA